MDRRRFLTWLGAMTAGVGITGRRLDGATLQERYALRIPERVRADRLELTAGPSTADFGAGRSPVWTLNGQFPGPTLHLRRGETADITLTNRLSEPTILHWHGLDVPEAADGHPRLVIDPGGQYRYTFPVRDRAGLYWYHPHTHHRTAPQTYQGMAGLLVIEDPEESSLPLPDAAHELPLILQDKRLRGGTSLAYDAASMGPDMMLGYLGDTPFANGVAHATVPVDRTRYRLRLLNASNARIFDVGLSTGVQMLLIGSDGGLLERTAPVDRVMLATGERADVLVDFSHHRPGDRVVLRSFPFEVPGMMGMGGGMGGRGMGRGMGGMMGGMAGVPPQGAGMDLLEFVVRDTPPLPGPPLPDVLSRLPAAAFDARTPRRTFRFESAMMRHTINGRVFVMDRVDFRVPRGTPEVWVFENPSGLPHPVHVHVGQFRVLSRTGGRERVMPWEAGLKDTVLVLPGERVEVGVRFDEYTGLFLMHCHNLEHEDMGMMLNFEVY
jgi:blue copper oxidase